MMKWEVVAGMELDFEERRQRIHALRKMLEALEQGQQVITPNVIAVLKAAAADGLRWMMYWHLMRQDFSVFQYERDPDKIEETVDRASKEM